MRCSPLFNLPTPRQSRQGIAVVWLLLTLPVLLILLCLVVEAGNLWLARMELKHAMESAALAAVKEWGDAGGGDTLAARNVGAQFSLGNTVRGEPVDLTSTDLNPQFDDILNYAQGNINGNAQCSDIRGANYIPSTVFVFGAITQFSGVSEGDPDIIFNAGVEPSCGAEGLVMVDVSNQGNVQADNAWGISFRTSSDPQINNNLRITRIDIDVDPFNTDSAIFDFEATTPPSISENEPQPKVQDGDENSQPDNFGWASTPPSTDPQSQPPTDQITFSQTTGTTEVLSVFFSPDPMNVDDGFAPGDRFRFGARVRRQQGNAELSGDDLGNIPARITVYYSLSGNPLPAVSGFLFNNSASSNQCVSNNIVIDDLGYEHVVVHPDGILDLPCPPTSAANNNGQSYGTISQTGGSTPFAVRAQANIRVPSVMQAIAGVPLGPFSVSAEGTAMYQCNVQDPRLIRVDQFLCD
ncbi:MAG: pilus assembly protein TadG-related protein [Pirellulaceae bacterium]